jgi:phosphatidylglycerophosphate synthase
MIVTAFAMRAFYMKTPLRTTLVGKIKTALQLVTLVLALLYAQLIPLKTLDWEPAVVWLHSPLPAGLFPWLFGLSAALTVWASLLNLHINLLKRWRRGEAWPVEENADTR